jgi:hypothetical protein
MVEGTSQRVFSPFFVPVREIPVRAALIRQKMGENTLFLNSVTS